MIGGGRARVVDRGTHRGVRRELFAEPRVSRTWLSRTPSLELGRAEPRVWNLAEPNPGFGTSPEPNPGFTDLPSRIPGLELHPSRTPGLFTDLPSRTPGLQICRAEPRVSALRSPSPSACPPQGASNVQPTHASPSVDPPPSALRLPSPLVSPEPRSWRGAFLG
jgi:hypothetical protein